MALRAETACALRSVTSQYFDLQGWDKAFRSMGELKNPQELSLEYCQNLPTEGLRSLIAKSQSLKTINFQESDSSSTSLSALMEALSTKQPVKVFIGSDALNDDVIAFAFATGWKDSTVEDLDICSRGTVTGQMLKLLVNLPRLKRLSFWYCEHITRDDIYGFLCERKDEVEILYRGTSSTEDLHGRYIRERNGAVRFIPC